MDIHQNILIYLFAKYAMKHGTACTLTTTSENAMILSTAMTFHRTKQSKRMIMLPAGVSTALNVRRSGTAHDVIIRARMCGSCPGICTSTVLPWTSDDRNGIDGTMHRISRIRDPIYDKVTSLTVRVGRSVLGMVETIADII